jgi:DNA-binding CsgD family transcriptional regulator
MIKLHIRNRQLVSTYSISSSLKSNIYTIIVVSLMLINTTVVAATVDNIYVVATIALTGLVVIWIFGKYQEKTPGVSLSTEEAQAYYTLISAHFQGITPFSEDFDGEMIDLPLSKRELEVLTQIAEGNSNKQIALELKISDQTVKNHLKNIYAKLEVDDRLSAVMLAMRNGWIESLKNRTQSSHRVLN